MLFKDFIKISTISFVVPSMRLSSSKFANLLNERLLNSRVTYDLPDENMSDILIIVPTNAKVFEDILPSSYLNKNYTKYPHSIIVVLGFDVMIKISHIFEHIKAVSMYNIPVLYSPILETDIEFDFKLVNKTSYEESLLYNKGEGKIHITDPNTFNTQISKMLNRSSDSMYTIYCYYLDKTNEKDVYKKKIKYFNEVVNFYSKLIRSEGKELKMLDNDFVVN